MQFVVSEKFTSAYLFQNYLPVLIIPNYFLMKYMKNLEMVKQNKRTRITQSGKICAINCTIQGMHLIWKQKIWLAIFEFLW